MNIHIDSFSGSVSHLKPKDRNLFNVLHVLSKKQLVSTWDMSEEEWLRSLINESIRKGLIKEINESYPWHRFELTDEGTKFISKKD